MPIPTKCARKIAKKLAKGLVTLAFEITVREVKEMYMCPRCEERIDRVQEVKRSVL